MKLNEVDILVRKHCLPGSSTPPVSLTKKLKNHREDGSFPFGGKLCQMFRGSQRGFSNGVLNEGPPCEKTSSK